MSKKLSSFAVLLVALFLGMRSAFAITWFSEETRLDELYNDIYSSAPNLGTQTEFGYMGSTMGSDDDDWICFTAGKSGTLTISQYSSSNTEVYHDVTYFTDPIATPYVSGKMSVSKGVKYYFCINNYKLFQTSEFYYWVFSIGGTSPTPYVTISPTSASKGSSSGTGSISVSANTSWSASTSASWITISSGKSGSGSGTINYSYSANSSTSSRTGYIYVSYSSGEASFKLTQSGYTAPSKPDLKPYTPSGWSAPLVITTSPSSTTSSSSFKDTDTIYVRRAVSCSGKSVGAFKTALYVDGTLKKTFETDSLAVDKYVYHTSGVSIGTLSAGSHTIKIVVDSGSAISESDEGNNTYTKTITVTATQKYYTVKFHKNDGSGITASRSFPIGKSQNLPWLNSGLGWYYDGEGLQFDGWSHSSISTFVAYENGESVYNLTSTEGGTVDLYAVLSANVYFAAGGGTGSKSALKFARGARYTLPSCPFTRTDYTFAGWKVTSCCSYFDNPVAAGTQITINENTTLTATWKAAPPKTYTVRFHKNEPDKGNINPTKPADTYYDQSFTVGKSQNLAWKDSQLGWTNPKYYRFLGWARSSSATAAQYANGQSVLNLGTANERIDLYAVWALMPSTYLVRFYRNNLQFSLKAGGSEDVYEQSFKIGAYQALAWKDSQMNWGNPSGKTFLGWAKSRTATVAAYKNGESVRNIGADGEVVRLYAVWGDQAQTYTVRFNKNDGNGATETRTYSAGASLTLPWINSGLGWTTPSGWSIVGWARSASATTAAYANGAKVPALGTSGQTVDLYVVWKRPVQTYTVRYNKNDGSGAVVTRTYAAGASLTLPWINSGLNWSTPSGWTIVGWARSASATSAEYANGAKVPALGTARQTVDLYVVWKKPITGKYTVVLHRNFNSADTPTRELVFACGVEQQLPWMDSQIAWTPRSGYAFLGWSKSQAATSATYTNGQKVTDLGSANSTVHLYAIWKANPVKSVAMPLRMMGGAVESRALLDDGEVVFVPGLYRGEFKDGSGAFDLLIEEDGSAFFRAETEDGVWAGECEVTGAGEMLLLTFEADEPIVIRMENGQMTAEGADE